MFRQLQGQDSPSPSSKTQKLGRSVPNREGDLKFSPAMGTPLAQLVPGVWVPGRDSGDPLALLWVAPPDFPPPRSKPAPAPEPVPPSSAARGLCHLAVSPRRPEERGPGLRRAQGTPSDATPH